MKLFVFLFALSHSTSLLLAQSSGGGAAAGTAPAGQQPAQTIRAQTAPVQGSAVQGSAVQGSAVQGGAAIDRPVAGGVLGTGQQAVQGTQPESGVTGGTSGAGIGSGITAESPRTPTGVEIANPSVPPLVNSLPPPIRAGVESPGVNLQVVEPSGAVNDAGAQGTGGTTGATLPQARSGRLEGVGDEALAQRFQGITSRPGSVQMAFPQDNAVVTIVSRDGNLTLQGAVSSEQQRQNIEQSIRRLSPGGFVDNQLRVLSPDDTNPEQTRSSVVP